MSLLDHVLRMLACFTYSRAYVLGVPTCLCFRVLSILACFMSILAHMSGMLAVLSCLMCLHICVLGILDFLIFFIFEKLNSKSSYV